MLNTRFAINALRAAVLLTCVLGSSDALAGLASKGFRLAAKQSVRAAALHALNEAGQKQVREAQKKIAGKLGEGAEDVLRKAAIQSGRNADEFVIFASKHSDDFSKIYRAGDSELLGMVARNGDAGRFLFSRFYGKSGFAKGSPWFGPQADEAVQEAWKLVAPGRIDGSWIRLRGSMTKANLNGPERDFCEQLFLNRVRAGRIPGVKADAIVDGHLGDLRTGFDFLGIDRRTGRVNIIEFSTGKKPTPGNPRQMTDEWVAERWSELVSNPSARTMLRENGVNPKLLDPNIVKGTSFKVTDHFDKTICAPEISLSSAKDLGARAVLLP
jgi:hypothetical protein